MPRMVLGRVVLIGDAAFVARPHVGAGVTKAAGDADALANAIASATDLSSALRAFETERLAIGHRIVGRARELGAALQATVHSQQERAAAVRYRTPDAIMRETASLAFLADG